MKLSPYQSRGALAILWFCGLCCSSNGVIAQSADQLKHPYASDKRLSEPAIFGEGVISTGDFDSHPAFTPDGKTLYFVRSAPAFNHWTILVSRFENGKWSEPQVAPFSGQYSDADPFITPDGSRFYFISDRPVAGKAKTDTDIWMMGKSADGWSEPKNLGAPVNSEESEWYPTVAANGTIYFGSDRKGGKGGTDLYRSQLVEGKYEKAENLGDAINTKSNEFEAWIAPDETFMIFMAGGHPDGRGGLDLFLTYQRNGAWTKPINLGDKINSVANEYSPKISPDGKYFFWTSKRGFADKPLDRRLNYPELTNKLHSARNGLGDIYQIDISELHIEK